MQKPPTSGWKIWKITPVEISEESSQQNSNAFLYSNEFMIDLIFCAYFFRKICNMVDVFDAAVTRKPCSNYDKKGGHISTEKSSLDGIRIKN